MRDEQLNEAPALVELGEVAILTRGAALGVPDLGGGQKIVFDGLSDD